MNQALVQAFVSLKGDVVGFGDLIFGNDPTLDEQPNKTVFKNIGHLFLLFPAKQNRARGKESAENTETAFSYLDPWVMVLSMKTHGNSDSPPRQRPRFDHTPTLRFRSAIERGIVELQLVNFGLVA